MDGLVQVAPDNATCFPVADTFFSSFAPQPLRVQVRFFIPSLPQVGSFVIFQDPQECPSLPEISVPQVLQIDALVQVAPDSAE